MHNSLHALVVAQYTQDRIAEATSARRARESKGDREPKSRRAPATVTSPETAQTITVLPTF
jgi:hypothetical protein